MHLCTNPPYGAAVSYCNSENWPGSSNLSAHMAASIRDLVSEPLELLRRVVPGQEFQ